MTFDECYQATILPAFEEILASHTSEKDDRSGIIDQVGRAYRLYLVKGDSKAAGWLISIQAIDHERPDGRLEIYGMVVLNGRMVIPLSSFLAMKAESLNASHLHGLHATLKAAIDAERGSTVR